jgi:hypothetical protein
LYSCGLCLVVSTGWFNDIQCGILRGTVSLACLQDNNLFHSPSALNSPSSVQLNEIELNLLLTWQLAVCTGRAPISSASFQHLASSQTDIFTATPHSSTPWSYNGTFQPV